ncbi:TIGR03083 family protein [Actinopolyspora mzabensis]|uniref:TIGR03083 family protein n=1 Tax=Actinopolyspora mzabensis TaxID=995066 RepID=A0A1G8WVJ0_ACTMZ|nr:maleylpyruvate isomerase N-terminal domain-containing protein [Actinopolyspora mzabensis]SDJ82409.1 TIGR03083 family protein [Actinopolyspora mzabensis]
MNEDPNHARLREHATALREAASGAGADAAVPTCPEWDVLQLVRHLGKVYAMVGQALRLDPEDSRPRPESAPREFDAALHWMDERLTELTTRLAAESPDRAVWSFFPGGTPRNWARRMVHETAIHRLDAEYALPNGGSDERGLLFDAEFAADGIDEFLTMLLAVGHDWSAARNTGRLLFHAVDVERAWLVTFEAGQSPSIERRRGTATGDIEPEATVAGEADTLYRRVWGRPNTATTRGDRELAGLVNGR